MMKFKLIYCSLVLFCMFSACTSKKEDELSPDGKGTDRQVMLKHMADEVILPGYAAFKIKLDAMTAASSAFTTTPTEANLLAFRQAWLEAYTEWQKVELFDIGPATTHSIRSFYNIYPARVDLTNGINGINQNITNGNANLDTPGSYPTQGFPAFDYLLNGVASTDADIVAYYTTEADADKRIAYIQKLTAQMNTKFNEVYSEWTGSYRADFISKTGTDVSSSTALLVNGFVMNYERFIRSGKFGIPSDAMNNGANPAPQLVESYYKKDLSLTLAQTAHQASVDFFNGKSRLTGTNGPSLKTYLDAINAKDQLTGDSLSVIINAQFASAKSKMDLLGPDLSNEVQTNNQAVITVFTEMQKAVRMLKVDMTSAMSIMITYIDNDGD